MKKFLLIALGLIFLATPALAEKSIQLKDGSVLNGKVISMTNGVYKIQTDNIGVIEIHEAKVQTISDGSPAPSKLSNTAIKAQTEHMQNVIFSDPQLMKGIEGLANNPKIMELIQNPTLLQDLMSMDQETIQNNPAIQKLMNDPQMKALINQVGNKITP